MLDLQRFTPLTPLQGGRFKPGFCALKSSAIKQNHKSFNEKSRHIPLQLFITDSPDRSNPYHCFVKICQ